LDFPEKFQSLLRRDRIPQEYPVRHGAVSIGMTLYY